MTVLLLAVTLLAAPTPTQPQLVAQKALAGDFGKLAPWQVEGYKQIAAGKCVRKVAWITHYATGEPGVGTVTASGRKVEAGRTLAMLGVPFGTFVLLDLPTGYGLRQVWDRGSQANLPRAKRKGAQTWCDIYTTSRKKLNVTAVRPVWVARVVLAKGAKARGVR